MQCTVKINQRFKGSMGHIIIWVHLRFNSFLNTLWAVIGVERYSRGHMISLINLICLSCPSSYFGAISNEIIVKIFNSNFGTFYFWAKVTEIWNQNKSSNSRNFANFFQFCFLQTKTKWCFVNWLLIVEKVTSDN